LVGLAVLFATRASAQTALPLELDWRAPTECASSSAIREELARITRVPAGVTLQPLIARVDIHRSGAMFVAALRTEHEGRAGERRLEADSCPTLVRSITLVLALAFGSGVEVSEPTRVEAAQPKAAGSSVPSRSDEPRDASAATSEASSTAGTEALSDPSTPDRSDHVRPLRWNLWLTGGAQFGLLPSTAFVTSLGAELETPRVWIGLRAQFWPGVSQDMRTDQAGQVEARYAALGLAVRGCLVPLQTLTLALCGTFGVAAIRGAAMNADRVDGSASIAPWYTGELAAAIDWPRAARVRLRLEANLTTSLSRPQFTIEGVGTAHHVPLFVPLFAAGVVLSL
jgi:hypothetical protein